MRAFSFKDTVSNPSSSPDSGTHVTGTGIPAANGVTVRHLDRHLQASDRMSFSRAVANRSLWKVPTTIPQVAWRVLAADGAGLCRQRAATAKASLHS